MLSILCSTLSCLLVNSAALNNIAFNYDPIALDGTGYSGSITEDKGAGYRIDIPEEGYLVINFTFYAPLHMEFVDVENEVAIDSYYYSSSWKKASAQNPVTQQYTYSVQPGAQLLRINALYAQPVGDYEFNAVYTPYGVNEIENNNIEEYSTAKACPIEIGEKIVGSFTPGDIKDYYVFTLEKDSRLSTVFTYFLPIINVSIKSKQSGKLYYCKNVYSNNASFEKPMSENIEIDLAKGTYYLVVGACTEARGKYEFALSAGKPLIVPTGLKVTVRQMNKQTVVWNKAEGADGYQVQCSDGGTLWKYTKTGTNTGAAFTGLTPGGRYKFRVRSYTVVDGERKFSAWTKTLTSCAKPATVKKIVVSSPKKGQLKTAWVKAAGVVSGYQVQISKNKSFTQLVGTKTIKTEKTLLYLGGKLTSGKTYYVRVRAYTVFNRYYFGAWSAAGKIKVK